MENVTAKKPDDFIISTGKQYSVKQFVNIVLNELNLRFFVEG